MSSHAVWAQTGPGFGGLPVADLPRAKPASGVVYVASRVDAGSSAMLGPVLPGLPSPPMAVLDGAIAPCDAPPVVVGPCPPAAGATCCPPTAERGGPWVPNIMGDFTNGFPRFPVPNEITGAGPAAISIYGADRRFKVAEDTSALPQNRFFLDYSHFRSALVDVNSNGHHMEQYTLGMEMTLLSEVTSIEVRLPFSRALDSRQLRPAGAGDNRAMELGNVVVVFKAATRPTDAIVLATGLGVGGSTGNDSRLLNTVNGRELTIQNQAVHLQPFLAMLYSPGDQPFTSPVRHFFFQTFLQFDFDTTGNEVTYSDPALGIREVAVLQDPALMAVDAALGFWLFRDRYEWFFSGLAPVVELHYTTTLQDQDVPTGPILQPAFLAVGDARYDVLNLTAGFHVQLGEVISLGVGAVAPLRDGNDKPFETEIIAQMNARF